MVTYSPVKRTAMYHAQVTLGAVMGEADGWQQAARFGPTANELDLLRTAAGIHDISPNGQVRVIGDGGPEIMRKLAPIELELAVGRVMRAEISTGAARLSVKIARLTGDEFVVLTAPGQAPAAVAVLEAAAEGCAHVLDISSAMAGVALTGPSSSEILSAVTELNVSSQAMPNLACAQSRFAEIQGLLLRDDVAGLLGYQLYVTREFGEYFWKIMIEAANHTGAGPVGTEAVADLVN